MKTNKILKVNIQMIKTVFNCAPLYVIISIISSLISAGGTVLITAVLIRFILNAFALNTPLPEILKFLAFVGIVSIIQYGLEILVVNIMKPNAQIKAYRNMHLILYNKAIKIDLSCYDNPEFYNDFILAMTQAANKAIEVFETLMNLLSHFTMFIGLTFFMARISPITLIPSTLYFIISFIYNIKSVKINYKKK